MKLFKYFFEALFIYTLFLLFKILGINLARKFSSFLLVKTGYFFRGKKIIRKNFLNVFKEYNDTDINYTMKSMWSNYGQILAEYMFLKKFRFNQFKKKHIEILGWDKLSEDIKIDKPMIFISGHFGNFELMAMELEKKGINLAAIYRPLNNFFLNPLMEYLRKKYICKNQIKKGLKGTRKILDFVKNKHSVALMVDQRVGESDRYPFFGKFAHTTTIPAQLALKFNLKIFPIYLERKNDNTFKMEILDQVKIEKTNDVENDKKKITIEINKVIEKMILRNPGQWIWTHSRWK